MFVLSKCYKVVFLEEKWGKILINSACFADNSEVSVAFLSVSIVPVCVLSVVVWGIILERWCDKHRGIATGDGGTYSPQTPEAPIFFLNIFNVNQIDKENLLPPPRKNPSYATG